MHNFTYINTNEELEKAAQEWSRLRAIGVDVECENNMHHYGAYITIFQLSSGTKHWIVDALRMGKVEALLGLLRNPGVQKVFHDTSFDLRIIHHQYGCRVRNVFDTQVAALLLGYDDMGLGPLLQRFYGVKKEQKMQVTDWTKRPLSPEMLSYAIKDAMYLVPLRDRLAKELKAKGRLGWMMEECRHIEKNDLSLHEPSFWDLRGLRALSDRQRAIVKRLYALRNQMAKSVNRPVHYLFSNSRLLELATNPPTLEQWQNMKGVHPVVKQRAKKLFDTVEKAKRERVTIPEPERKRYTPQQRNHLKRLSEARDAVAQRLGIQAYLVMSKDQMHEIVQTGSMKPLRKWQYLLVKKRFKY